MRPAGRWRADADAPSRPGRAVLSPTRRRLDTELVRRGLADSREQAAVAVSPRARPRGGAPPPQSPRASCRRPTPWSCSGPDPVSCRAAATSSTPRWTASSSTSPVAGPSTPVPSTGGFVDCLLQRGAPRSSRSTSVAASSTRGCATTRGWSCTRGSTCATRDPRSLGSSGPVDLVTADLSFISLRTVAAGAGRDWLRPGGDLVALGEAAVRGRAGRGVPGQGGHQGPRAVARRLDRGVLGPPGRGNRHHGGHGVTATGSRRERGVLRSTPSGGRAGGLGEIEALADAAVAEAPGGD